MGNRNGKPGKKQVHNPKNPVGFHLPPAADSARSSLQKAIQICDTTPENVNFFRLARLILDVCNNAMRDLLQSIIKGGEEELTKRIAYEKNFIITSCRLSKKQQDTLFPSNNAFVNYHSLDFTLMYTICRNVLYNEIEIDSKSKRKWGKTPHPTDTTLLSAIETIRECRNTFFAHATSSQLNDKKFNETWITIEKAVNTIDDHLDRKVVSTRYKDKMKKLKHSSTDPKLRETMLEKIEIEERYIELFEMEALTNRKLEEIIHLRNSYSINSLASSMNRRGRQEMWASSGNFSASSMNRRGRQEMWASTGNLSASSMNRRGRQEMWASSGNLSASSMNRRGRQEMWASSGNLSDTYDYLDEPRPLSGAHLESVTRLGGHRKSSAGNYSYNDSNCGRLPFGRTSLMDMKDSSYDSGEETYTTPFHLPKDNEMDCHYDDSGISNTFYSCGSANTDTTYGTRMSKKESSKSYHPRFYIKRRKSSPEENAYSNIELDSDGRQCGTVSNKQHRYIQDTEPKAECSEFSVTLITQGEQYGFSLEERIRGDSQVYISISRILLGGPAYSILLTGDEITHVDEVNVMNYPKQRVVCLLKQTSKTGYLTLKIRRRNLRDHWLKCPNNRMYVMESNGCDLKKMQAVLDKLTKYNLEERYNRLPIRHNILAQNGNDVSHMHPEDIVKLVEDAGYSITLSMGSAKRLQRGNQ